MARIDAATGVVTPLRGRAAPDEVVTEADVQDPAKLAKLLTRMLAEIAAVKRRRHPRTIDFHDIVTTNGGAITLQHNFKGRAVWTVIDCLITGAAAAPIIQRDVTRTTADVLVLLTYTAGVVSIRVEEFG